jgi:hypothetical protein
MNPLNSLNGLTEALDNLNQLQIADDENEENTNPELTPTMEKADFFVSSDSEEDWCLQ